MCLEVSERPSGSVSGTKICNCDIKWCTMEQGGHWVTQGHSPDGHLTSPAGPLASLLVRKDHQHGNGRAGGKSAGTQLHPPLGHMAPRVSHHRTQEGPCLRHILTRSVQEAREGGHQLRIRPLCLSVSVTLTKVLEASHSAFRNQVTATHGLGCGWAGPASAWVVRAQR